MSTSITAYLKSIKYTYQSFKTASYWRYALWKLDSFKTLFATVGLIWLGIELGDYCSLWERSSFPRYTIFLIFAISIFAVIVSRRPLTKITLKVPGKDLSIEVRIENIFEIRGDRVIGTNRTFDTSLANRIISAKSIQGQFTTLYYPQNVQQLDDAIEQALRGVKFENTNKPTGKTNRYPYGTTVPLKIGQEVFYFLAMAELNDQNVASSTPEVIKVSLEKMWKYIAENGDTGTLVVPVMGTNYGRVGASRKKMINLIAESFLNASDERVFSNKLIIAIFPGDVERFGINLFEVKDMLYHIIHQ